MSNMYVEQEDEGYVAFQNKQIITRGETQEETARPAHQLRPVIRC